MRFVTRFLLLALSSIFAATLASHALAAGAPHVQTVSGIVEGTRDGPLVVFRGIPYAAPPVGRRRWRPPVPARAWSGIRRADHFAPACPQIGVSMPGEAPPQQSEDCLYLNVWAPAHANNLPVIVWIHGGGFTNGSAAMPLYWGDRLARRGAIVVSLGYRLGPLGFLAHPGLSAETPRHSSGNYGLLDQIAALEWVRNNVSRFGGDPRRVTIAGQSAGATSVSILMASPRARGLFQRAIGQSGGLFEPEQLAPSYQLAQAERDGVDYARSVGASSLAELRRLPVRALLGGQAGRVTHPVFEPVVLPRSPYAVFAAGGQNDVPLLIGSNAQEGRSLIEWRDVTAGSYAAEIVRSWGELPSALYDSYPHSTDEEAIEARLGFERDLRFGWDMWAWARLQRATGRSPVYYYHFAQQPPFPVGSAYAGWGASHFAELWYMSDHLDQEPWDWSSDDRALADAMAGYWVNFARSGDPNGGALPTWYAFTRARPDLMMFATPMRSASVPNLRTLGVFDSVYDQVRGAPFQACASACVPNHSVAASSPLPQLR